MVAVPDWLPVYQLAVVVALVGSLLVVRRVDRSGPLGRRLRTRLLLGVPWGTVVSLLGVLAVYLFVQGGYHHFNDPVTIPFRAWSYFYPLGTLLAAFSHNGPNHILGNLTSALPLAVVAEYAWGHYPRGRGESSFASLRTNPYVRAFVLFPLGAFVVGVLTAVFSWGPIIGFSGVVFAFAGFALVRYPLAAVVGLVVRNLVGLTVAALRQPVVTAEAKPQYVTPWWAGIATQGHLLGLFLGVVAGALVLPRSERPSTRRLFLGALLVASSFSLWLVWWYRGGEHYVLYQGLGVALLFVVALLVTLGLRERWSPGTVLSVPRPQVGLLLLLLPVLVVGFAAVPLNLATVANPAPPGSGPVVHVGDYTVSYGENVTNQMVSVVDLSVLGETTEVRTSGVVVVSERRHIWTQSLSKGRLKFAGQGKVVVGGVGWRETVHAARRGWVAVGNGSTYVVFLKPPGGGWQVAYTAPAVVAEPVVSGDRVAVNATRSGFVLEARRNGTVVGSAPMLEPNATVTLGNVTLVRENASIFATSGQTRVRVADEETYQG